MSVYDHIFLSAVVVVVVALCAYFQGHATGYAKGSAAVEKIYVDLADKISALWKRAYDDNSAAWRALCHRIVLDHVTDLAVRSTPKTKAPPS